MGNRITDGRFRNFLSQSFTGNCVDNNEWCGEWASYGFCKDDAHTGYMLVSYKKSCGVCGNGGGGSEHTTETPSTATSFPVTTVTPSPGNLIKYPDIRFQLKFCTW